MTILRQIRYLTLRSIRARWLRFLLSAFGIILGVAGMLAIRVTNEAAMNSIVRLFANTAGSAKLSVTSADQDTNSLPEKALRLIANTPGVALASPILRVNTVAAEDADANQLALGMLGATTTGGITLHGIDPARDPKVREYNLIAGRFLKDTSPEREVVLVQDYAEDQDLKIGDPFTILTPGGAEDLQVVGFIAREGAGQTNNGSFGVIPLETAQELFNRNNELDQVDILTTGPTASRKELELLKQNLQTRLGHDYAVTYPSSQGERMTQMLQNYQIGLNFMSGIALFVGAFLIYNAFAMTVVERTREFGMLRTIGMTRNQVTGLILLEAAVLGVFGSLAGLALGMLLARGLTQLMSVILNQPLDFVNVPVADLVSSWLIGVAVTFLAAGIPAWQAGRISPMEALRVRGRSREGWLIREGWKLGLLLLVLSTILLIANPFPYDVQFRLGSLTVFGLFSGATLLIPASVYGWERVTRPLMKWIYGASGSLGSRNVQRSRQRATLTVAALMVGVAMVIMTRGMTESFAGDLKNWMTAYIGGDIYAGSSVPLRNDVGQHIRAVPGVAAVAPIRYLNVDWRTPEGVERINFMALDPDDYTRVTRFVFSDPSANSEAVVRRLQQGNAVLVSSVLSEKYGIQPGDVIQIKTSSGYRPFEVAAIVVDFYNQGLVVQGSWNDMKRYFRVKEASIFLIKVADGQSIETVQARIDDLYGKRYHLVLLSNTSIRDQAMNLMDQAFSMFDVMALIAIVVGSLGVVNTLTMSVIERTQEIGMLRAIGMTRPQVIRMVLAEAGLMGVIGGVLGVCTGIVLARILFIGMNSMSGYDLTFVLPPEGVAISLIAAIIISQIAAVFPSRRASRVKILEALHYE
jgi:putative ABC transport system permease protein